MGNHGDRVGSRPQGRRGLETENEFQGLYLRSCVIIIAVLVPCPGAVLLGNQFVLEQNRRGKAAGSKGEGQGIEGV